MLTKFNVTLESTDTGIKARPFYTAPGPPDGLKSMSLRANILHNVCLMKYHHNHGVYSPAVLLDFAATPKAKGMSAMEFLMTS